MKRCSWCNDKNELYKNYHDKEWGIPSHNDSYLFEILLLETFQSGLSWECILNKREFFRKAFDNFDYKKIAKYDDKKIEELLKNGNIIRNKLKIQNSINLAKTFIDIQNHFYSFNNYIWGWNNNKTIKMSAFLTSCDLSDKISKDLKYRNLKFVGTITIHSYLCAIGIISAHEEDCFCFNKL